MPDLPISGLPSSSIVSQSNILPIVQGGITNKITAENLGKGIFTFNLPLTASGGTFSEEITGNKNLTLSGSLTASLQQNYIWLGNSSNKSTPVPVSTITNAITGSFFNTGSFGFYGSFSSTASQTNPVGNVSRSIQLETTEYSNGVYISSGSRITVQHPGIYNLQFSVQLEKTDNGVDTAYIWFKKNGQNTPRSNTSIDILKQAGGSGRFVAAWNYIESLSANDYLEVVWQAEDTTLLLPYVTASGNLPEIPSAIVTLTQVS
jgi:hypothetical protein